MKTPTFVAVVLLLLGLIVQTSSAKETSRILGGIPTKIEAVPFLVSLQILTSNTVGNHLCSGTILNSRTVLTGASCFYGQTTTNFAVRAGSSSVAQGGQLVRVSHIFLHPQYNPQNNANDVAVLKLVVSLRFDSGVQPATLARTAPAPGTSCTVSGWGRTDFAPLASTVQSLTQHVIDLSICAGILAGSGNPVNTGNLCAGAAIGKGACAGDGASPLVCGNSVAGIVSWGIPCARGLPDVYTSVSFYANFIHQF